LSGSCNYRSSVVAVFEVQQHQGEREPLKTKCNMELSLVMNQSLPSCSAPPPRHASPSLCGARWSTQSLRDRTELRDAAVMHAAAVAAAAAPIGACTTAQGYNALDQQTLKLYRTTCDYCSVKKQKCSGGSTRCERCAQKGQDCVYR
jgi:Fungal Zn(2)-Cys(6) binuclear cluster domain